MWADPLTFFLSTARAYGEVVSLSFGSRRAFLLNHPTHIKYVLQDHNRNYRKSTTVKVVSQVLGKGLATNEGDSWLQQRRLLQPAFHRQSLAQLGELIMREVTALAAHWQRLPPDEPLDMLAEMMRLTLRLVLKTMFGHDTRDKVDELGAAWTEVLQYFNAQSWSLVQLPDNLPTPANRRFHHALALLNQEVQRMIALRRKDATPRADLLDLLLRAQDAGSGLSMSDQQVRDEIMTIFLAGHETTATALSWTWYLLAQHPTVAQALRNELAAVLAGRAPTVVDLPQLPYTRMVIDEALRLYPPFWLIYRAPYALDIIGGYTLKPNDMVFISPYVMHRLPAWWEQPDVFDPTRFTEARNASRPPFVYFPFGGGPHQCIGNNLALMEAQLTLATLAQQFDAHLCADAKVTTDASVTLRPRGLRMRLARAT
jgi:cytochrome P450